jgi:hypothetical protein
MFNLPPRHGVRDTPPHSWAVDPPLEKQGPSPWPRGRLQPHRHHGSRSSGAGSHLVAARHVISRGENEAPASSRTCCRRPWRRSAVRRNGPMAFLVVMSIAKHELVQEFSPASYQRLNRSITSRSCRPLQAISESARQRANDVSSIRCHGLSPNGRPPIMSNTGGPVALCSNSSVVPRQTPPWSDGSRVWAKCQIVPAPLPRWAGLWSSGEGIREV